MESMRLCLILTTIRMKSLFLSLLLFLSNYGLAQHYFDFSCNQNETNRVEFFVTSQGINLVMETINNTGVLLKTCESQITPSNPSLDLSLVDPLKLKFILGSYNNLTGLASMIFDDSTSSINGETFTINLNQLLYCTKCSTIEREPITVLHADATEFSDEWGLNYKELTDESTDVSHSLSDIANNPSLGNPYAFGLKGIWRPKRTSAYLIDRLQSGTYGDKLRLDKDGEYKEFYWFDWTQPIQYNEDYNWRWVNEVTKYNVNGASKEGRNRLDIHAASLFGYNNHLVTASASNSKTTDIAFDGFEDYSIDQYNVYRGIGHGNLDLSGNQSEYLLSNFAHTGDKSLVVESVSHKVDYNQLNRDFFYPEKTKTYFVSAWTYCNQIPENGMIEVKVNNSVVTTMSIEPTSQTIDGWHRLTGTFAVPQSATTFEIVFRGNEVEVMTLFDDIRIQPFNSGMETYVYDPTNYRLRATLSNQNYATFYNYDEEGNLTQTKVETERGIKTISSNRNNIKK